MGDVGAKLVSDASWTAPRFENAAALQNARGRIYANARGRFDGPQTLLPCRLRAPPGFLTRSLRRHGVFTPSALAAQFVAARAALTPRRRLRCNLPRRMPL